MGREEVSQRSKENKNRLKNYMLRFNEEEFIILKNIFEKYDMDINKNRSVGPFLRSLILSYGETDLKKEEKSYSHLIYEINKIGNNINQIAKKINSNKRNIDYSSDLNDLKLYLLSILKSIKNDS